MFASIFSLLSMLIQVQEATEMFVAQIQSRRPATLQGPSLDFSKPRLVQISVSDVGACMPMAPMVCYSGCTPVYCLLSPVITIFADTYSSEFTEVVPCVGAHH